MTHFKSLFIMALTTVAITACTKPETVVEENANPLLNYANWTTPHSTYPFNEIHAADYMHKFRQSTICLCNR